MTFEDYLTSKKIDLNAFLAAEPSLFGSWKVEFEQLHPNSFTMQKFHLINPIRRKYTLKTEAKAKPETVVAILEVKSDVVNANEVVEPVQSSPTPPGGTDVTTSANSNKPVVKPPRPVFKPKPKIN